MGSTTACVPTLRAAVIGAALIAASLAAHPAGAWQRTEAELFAILPDGATGPEGLTVGPDGNIYVATFGYNSKGSVTGQGQLYVYAPDGDLLRHVAVANSGPHLLGIAFQPSTGALLVIDSGNSIVLRVDPRTGQSSVFMTVTGPAGLNGLAFDAAGGVYVSDSFQGIIWKTGPGGGAGTPFVTDPLLTTTQEPPFGANGIEFNRAQTTLFATNTGNRTVVQIPIANGLPGKPSVFASGVNGADGLVIDRHDNLWIAANQEDNIDVLDPSGKVIAKLGDFEGVTDAGVPLGLLFPASPDFSRDGRFLYVTNLALDLRLFGQPQAIDSQYTAQVRRYTIARIPARLPELEAGQNDR